MSESTEYLGKLRSRVVPQGPFNVTPHFADRAYGAIILDVEGREYVDFAGGIGVMNIGHSHPKVVAAIKDQAEKFTHTCFHVVMYEPYVALADRLCGLAPGAFSKMALLANSGAEAVENAIKVARHYTKRPAIIAFEHAFHGRTLLGMTLTSKIKPYKYGFGPLATDVHRVPYAYCYRCTFNLKYPECNVACADYLENYFNGFVAADSVAAVIAEPVAGEGGFIAPPPEYFPKIKSICEKYGIVFIADEIQSGTGRTGKMFAIEHWGVEPDIITLAKSMAAGMPLSAVIGRREMMDDPMVGGLGGTYGGNPICCRAALAALDVLEEENLLNRGQALGRTLKKRLLAWQEEFELIGDVRGLGPMLAIELVEDRQTKAPATDKAKALVKHAYENGLILLSCGQYGNVIRFLMPLVITDEQLERGLGILEDGLRVVSS